MQWNWTASHWNAGRDLKCLLHCYNTCYDTGELWCKAFSISLTTFLSHITLLEVHRHSYHPIRVHGHCSQDKKNKKKKRKENMYSQNFMSTSLVFAASDVCVSKLFFLFFFFKQPVCQAERKEKKETINTLLRSMLFIVC